METKAAVRALAALAQDSRLDVFRLLVQAGPDGLPAGEIADRLGIPASTLSFHVKALSQAGLAPKLFHKAALEGDDDSSLAGDIRNALANKKQRVVGIIINAVDDHLDKGEQIDAVWSTEHIRVLEPILAEARAAGRLVVLLSDHGHVLEAGSGLVTNGAVGAGRASDRWRAGSQSCGRCRASIPVQERS